MLEEHQRVGLGEDEGFALHTLNLSSLCTNVYVGRGVGRSCHVWDMNVGDSNG